MLDLDEHGWVRSLPDPSEEGYSIAATILDVPASLPAGRYVMRYAGEGELQYRLGARKIDEESAPGRDVLEIDVANGPIHIQILATNPDNYLRDLQLVREDRESLLVEQGEIFNPDFLDRTEPFEAVRFMEWSKTNGSEIERWDERALPDDARYTSAAGVPVETMVALAGQLGATPWFNVPHRADDDYVASLAALVHQGLPSGLDVYVEYSNEVWNSAFSQHAWVTAQGKSLWPGGPHSDYTKMINWYGKRSAEVCDIWKGAFDADGDRVICVIGAQAANDWTGAEALLCPMWAEGSPCIDHGIRAVAIAPYFGAYVGHPDNVPQLEAWASAGNTGTKALLTELSRGGSLPSAPPTGGLKEAFAWIEAYSTLAQENELELVGYEGGQHLAGFWGIENNHQVTQLFIAANRHKRMGSLYRRYLKKWARKGGGLMMHFSDISEPGKHGSWGALEHVLQTQSPKYNALLEYAGVAPAGQ